MAFLVFMYLQYVATQVMPDTATDWLDRWADIFLTNEFGGGRKPASLASGTVTAIAGSALIVPLGAQLVAPGGQTYQATQQTTVGITATTVPIVALSGGAAGDQAPGIVLGWSPAIAGLNGAATVISLTGGADEETDDELRARLLLRIRQPPMGGDASDYVEWVLGVPGVTRAWCSPTEMGPGTVTVRFMMDDLRAASGGFPTQTDVAAVQTYLNSKRPVTAIDCFVVAPIPEPISFTLKNLNATDSGTMANIAASVQAMLAAQGAPAQAVNGSPVPAQTIYAAWVSDAVFNAAGVAYFDLVMPCDHVMPTPSSIATLGSISLG